MAGRLAGLNPSIDSSTVGVGGSRHTGSHAGQNWIAAQLPFDLPFAGSRCRSLWRARAMAAEAPHARTASGAIELMPMHASGTTLPPLQGPGRRSSGHTRTRATSRTQRVDRLHQREADRAIATDLERYEAFYESAGGSHFVGVHASPSAAAVALEKVQREVDRESWKWDGESAAARRRRQRRGVSDSLLTPTPSYLMGLNAVRDFEDEVRASSSLPDLPIGDMSWVLAGELPDLEESGTADDGQMKARQQAAKAAAEERQARADAIRRKQREKEAAAAERAAKEAARLALRETLRACAESLWFEHDSSGYRLARPVGEKLVGTTVTWSQEDEDSFARTADSLKDDWFGACAPGWGFAMWPSVLPKDKLDGLLSRLEGGQVDASAVVEAWLASVDVGAAQLNRCFNAVRYKLGVDQNVAASIGVADACLALNMPKPPPEEPLRVTLATLAERAGVHISPTVLSVVPAAIEGALRDCGVSAIRRYYISQYRDGKPVYVLQTPQPPRGSTRRERAACGEEWWIGFLLLREALRAASAAAIAEDEDDFEAQQTLASFNLHEGWSNEAFCRAAQSVLETKPNVAMVAEECARLGSCLSAEFMQRATTDVLRTSLRGGVRTRSDLSLSLSTATADGDTKAESAALLDDCTHRLAALGENKIADSVKLLATRAAIHLESKNYLACIDDCSSALRVAQGVNEVTLPRCWSALVLRLRSNAHERLQDYDASHADASAAFQLSRSDPHSESAEVDYRLFVTETSVRWPTLAAAAQPTRPLPTRRPRTPQAQAVGLAKLSFSESDVPKPSRRSHTAKRSVAELRLEGPPSQCVRTGVSAEWLLEWSEANALAGGAEWYLRSRDGQYVVNHVCDKLNTNSKTAARATSKVLAEQGLIRPIATLCKRVATWTAAKNKNGSAGDLGADLPRGPRVADVIKGIVVPATRLTNTHTSFAEVYMQEGGGVGRATHLVIHARRGTWWGLVHACIVHTLGWTTGNEARSLTTAQLKKALRQHADKRSGADSMPLYWFDFFCMPQHGDPTAPSLSAGENSAASGLAAWREILSEVKRCVLVIGEAEDVMGPAQGALTAPTPLALQRGWCCTELLLASAARAEINLALSFAALHALSERLELRFGTPCATVTNSIQSCWAEWQPTIVLGDTRCTVDADTKALQRAVKTAGGGLNIADRKLRKLLADGGTTAALGLLDHFKIHGAI